MSHFLIVCGGTGGHLAPGISLARELKSAGHTCRLVISRKQVDQRLITAYPGLDFLTLPGRALTFRPLELARGIIDILKHFFAAFLLLRRERPDCIVAFGGFMSVGLVLLGFLKHIPVALHEANRRPGRAIRLLSPIADRIYLPDGLYLPGISRERIRHHGYPVRQEFRPQSRESARRHLEIKVKGKLLVVIGGSQGAKPLNDWVKKEAAAFAAASINVYCVTGLQGGAQSTVEWEQPDGSRPKTWFVPFSDQMPDVISAADLVITRAGAGSLAELARCRTPALVVPFPQSADNHQLANALFFEQRGAAIIIPQERIEDLRDEALELIFNEWLLQRLRDNLEHMEKGHDPADLRKDLEALIHEMETYDQPPAQSTEPPRKEVPA